MKENFSITYLNFKLTLHMFLKNNQEGSSSFLWTGFAVGITRGLLMKKFWSGDVINVKGSSWKSCKMGNLIMNWAQVEDPHNAVVVYLDFSIVVRTSV